jgi:hypothetical protein
VDWSQALFEAIDFRSFSTLWYWIVLAVVWSTASNWVLGVPFDMVLRARRQGDGALSDLETLVRINVNRIMFIARETGLWLAGSAAFILTALGTLAFLYNIEFAQAVFLIALPLTLVGLLSLAAAARIDAKGLTGDALCRLLQRHRTWTQVVGMISIFITALYGMYQNLVVVQGF